MWASLLPAIELGQSGEGQNLNPTPVLLPLGGQPQSSPAQPWKGGSSCGGVQGPRCTPAEHGSVEAPGLQELA